MNKKKQRFLSWLFLITGILLLLIGNQPWHLFEFNLPTPVRIIAIILAFLCGIAEIYFVSKIYNNK